MIWGDKKDLGKSRRGDSRSKINFIWSGRGERGKRKTGRIIEGE